MIRFPGMCVFAVVVALMSGCGKDPNLIDNQRASFASHFASRGYDSLVRGGVYVYVPNADRVGRESEPELDLGDSLYYYYEIYPYSSGFSASSLGNPSYLIATNNRAMANSIPGLNTQYLDLDIARAKLGSTSMIEGLKRGLKGSRQGDSLWLFMTSNLTYGDASVGIVGANAPLVFVINLDTVKKHE